jgi:hypothetical protein
MLAFNGVLMTEYMSSSRGFWSILGMTFTQDGNTRITFASVYSVPLSYFSNSLVPLTLLLESPYLELHSLLLNESTECLKSANVPTRLQWCYRLLIPTEDPREGRVILPEHLLTRAIGLVGSIIPPISKACCMCPCLRTLAEPSFV